MSYVRIIANVFNYLIAPKLLLGALIFAMMAMRGRKRNKDKHNDNSSSHSSQESNDDFDDAEVAQTPPKRKSNRGRWKKEAGESSNDIAATITNDYYCRFCPMKFDRSQALGGHMNRHRKEREDENLQKARDLVTNREQHYGPTTWNTQGAGAGTLQPGGNLLPNSPAGGGFLRPYSAPNQSAAAVQNWQMAQLPSPQQSSAYSLQSAPLASGGSYYDVQQLDNARPHPGVPAQATGVHLPAHQQLRVNPGQHNMVQQMAYSDAKPVLRSGEDFAGLQQSPYHLNQAGPSIGYLEDIVNTRSINPQVPSNNSLGSLIMHHSAQSKILFVDRFGNIPANNRLPPLNDVHFQQGQGQGHSFQDQQHYTSYDQELGTSVMGSIGRDTYNQAPGSGIRHMPRFQDSRGGQGTYRGGNDESSPVAEAGQAGLEGSPDTSGDGKP